MQKTLQRDFWRGAVPGILSLLLNSIYIVVDGLFVARLIGRDALSAVTVAVPMMEILIALSLLISVGAGVLISYHRGRGEMQQARDAFVHSFVFMLATSAVFCLGGVIFRAPLSRMLGATEELMEMVSQYLLYLMAFCPPLMLSYGLCAWARNDGKPNLALKAMTVGALVNILLDYVFIRFFHMGVGGAALATGLGPTASCLILLPHFLGKKGELYFERVRFRLSRVRAILFNGFPSFMMEFALGLTALLMNLAVARHMGTLGLAAYGIVGYVALILYTLFLGMAEGTQPLFSFYHGRGDGQAIAALNRLAMIACTAMGLLGYGLLIPLSRYPAMLFGGGDLQLIDLAVHAMELYFPALCLTGVNILSASVMQSVGRWQASAAVSFSRSILALALSLLVLPVWLGADGVWLAVPAAELMTLPLSLALNRT